MSEKILIISYFFPPCNLTASQRAYAWAKYLPDFGYEPVVVTRNWDVPVKSGIDMSRNAGEADRKVSLENFTAWYVRHRANLRDRVYVKYGDGRAVLLRRALSFAELLLQNFMVGHLSYSNMLDKAREILRADENISKVIVSGNPFAQFHFCYLLKKEFPRVRWIADYRDDWTTTEIASGKSFLHSLLHLLEQRSEKKWVRTASAFTATVQKGKERIGALLKIPGHVVVNGYAEEMLKQGASGTLSPAQFIITYNGNLYKTQPVEIFTEAFKKLVEKYKDRIKVVAQFPGLAFDKQQESRVKNLLSGYEENVRITPRISMQEVIEWQGRSNVLLLIGHKGFKGIAPSKMYEYIAFRKKILLCCNDHDALEALLHETRLGIICDTAEETVHALSREIENFMTGKNNTPDCDEAAIAAYSRKNQVGKLAILLDAL